MNWHSWTILTARWTIFTMLLIGGFLLGLRAAGTDFPMAPATPSVLWPYAFNFQVQAPISRVWDVLIGPLWSAAFIALFLSGGRKGFAAVRTPIYLGMGFAGMIAYMLIPVLIDPMTYQKHPLVAILLCNTWLISLTVLLAVICMTPTAEGECNLGYGLRAMSALILTLSATTALVHGIVFGLYAFGHLMGLVVPCFTMNFVILVAGRLLKGQIVDWREKRRQKKYMREAHARNPHGFICS